MSAQPSVVTSFPSAAIPRRSLGALEQLLRAFREERPLTVVVGAGYKFTHALLNAVEERVDAEVDVVRLSNPAQDPIECMRAIVQSIGFSTDGLELRDLQQILTMFLSYQKTHRRRTILYVENAHEASGWTLDTLDQMVARETRKRNGLFVLLAGNDSLSNVLRKPSLPALSAHADSRIKCNAFDLGETREYINRFVEADGRGEISELFEFDAITLVHDISEGVPDTINQLLGECLNSSESTPISPGVVEHIAAELQLLPESNAIGLTIAAETHRGWLKARLGNELVTRTTIEAEKLLIGRGSNCDLKLFAPIVSREHAIVLSSKDGVRVLDLGSTNGTFVNGERIENCQLEAAAKIRIGDYVVEYSPRK